MKMYEGVLSRVRKIEQKNGITYAKTDGKLYMAMKIIFIVSFIYAMGISLLYFAGLLLKYSDNLGEYSKYIITPAVCTALIIVGFVLFLKKLHFTSICFTVIPAVISALFFLPLMEGEYANTINPSYYWRHLAPMVLIATADLWGGIIGIRARLKTQKLYNRVTENLYATYKVAVNNGDEIDEDTWDEFLNNYDPLSYTPQFKKAKKSEE